MRDDFCVFILTHGRADSVKTAKQLDRDGYTGKTFFVVDDQDDQVDRYRENFGKDRVLVFDKEEQWRKCDPMDNAHRMGVILYARNACFDLARKVGVKYFLELDDDYRSFEWRWRVGEHLVRMDMRDLDSVFEAMIEFLIATNADTVAMAQAGDFVGGIESTAAQHPVLRKAMNTFFCRTDRRVRFQGSINEDVSMYALAGLRGRLILTLTSTAIVQTVTQTNEGGMSGTYLDGGTYLKSFYSVMAAPSCVKISMLHGGTKDTVQHWRIHHHVKWENCAAKIISEKWRKGRGGR